MGERILLVGVPLVVLFIYSMIVHEVVQGWVALRFGDPIAREKKLLTLNPIPFFDPIMSLMVPLGMFVMHPQLMFGGIKGIPIAHERLQPRIPGSLCIALAGLVTHLVLAVGFKLLITPATHVTFWPGLTTVITRTAWLNCLLVLFNLLPLPPLDGWVLLATFLPERLRKRSRRLEMAGLFAIVLIVVMFRGAAYQFIGWVDQLYHLLP